MKLHFDSRPLLFNNAAMTTTWAANNKIAKQPDECV